MSDDRIGEVLAAIIGLDAKVTGKLAELDAKVTGKLAELDAKVTGKLAELDAKVTALEGKFDQLEAGQTKMRVDIMARIDGLSEQVGFLRSDTDTTFKAADRAGRINYDYIRSLEEQMSSMVRQQRMLDSRLRAIEERPN